MGKCLVVSAHLPSPLATQAGQKVAFENLCELARVYDVTLIAARAGEEAGYSLDPIRDVCKAFTVCDVHNIDRIVGCLLHPLLPTAVGARALSKLEHAVREASFGITYDRVHCEWGQMAFLSSLVPGKYRSIYVHDVLSQQTQRRAMATHFPFALLAWLDASRTRVWESRAYRSFDQVFVPSTKDRDILVQLNRAYSRSANVVYPTFTTYVAANQSSLERAVGVLFWGSMSRQENDEAALWLLDRVMPQVRAKFPAARALIVGSSPSCALLMRAGEHTVITGYVSDPSTVFLQARVAVLPLGSGAGVKLKVLECLAAGIPVITTPIGAEGIPAGEREGLFVAARDVALFAQKTIEVLSAPMSQLWSLSEHARVWASQYEARRATIVSNGR